MAEGDRMFIIIESEAFFYTINPVVTCFNPAIIGKPEVSFLCNSKHFDKNLINWYSIYWESMQLIYV